MRIWYVFAVPVLAAFGLLVAPTAAAECTTYDFVSACQSEGRSSTPAVPYPCTYDAYYCNDGYNWFLP
ncbi:hypothetical protein [Mycobacterium sp. SMC-4]|uniref:hypothetical protein n=1 Tax=Mycobacterium sp. SMC-4 TaxID=2857059 RepID=UPI003CFCFE96